MKLSAAVIFASISGASAFAPSVNQKTAFGGTRLSMSETPMSEEATLEPAAVMAVEETEDAEPALPAMSQSMPFMERPAMLDGSLAGDVGFDPLGFAKSKDDLMNFREAEIKHARLAMLAAAGWPLSELFDKKLANWAGMAPLVDASDRAPSVLNGGLGKVSPVYWVACILAAGAIDAYGIAQSKSGKPDYFPGNLGFDPLGLYPTDKAGQERMQLAEIKNGRLAMIAITAFAVQEFVSQSGVIDETPVFFKPIGEVMMNYANSGYIAH